MAADMLRLHVMREHQNDEIHGFIFAYMIDDKLMGILDPMLNKFKNNYNDIRSFSDAGYIMASSDFEQKCSSKGGKSKKSKKRKSKKRKSKKRKSKKRKSR